MKAETPPRTWPGDIYKAFKRLRIQQVAYVPDAGHTQLILDCHGDSEMRTVSLTTEQEGVAIRGAPRQGPGHPEGFAGGQGGQTLRLGLEHGQGVRGVVLEEIATASGADIEGAVDATAHHRARFGAGEVDASGFCQGVRNFRLHGGVRFLEK